MAGDERPGPSPPTVDGGQVTAGQREPGTGRSGPAAGERGPGRAGPVAGARTPMDPVTWVIALAAFMAYDTLAVFRYLRLDPGSWDLGIYTEYVKQLAHLHAPVVSIRGAGFNLLGDHFQPIVGLLAPLFRVFPTPETLLVAQALLTAASVIPVCRAAQELLGTWASRGIGLAYGFSWGLQQMVSFDFHEIAFAVPLLAFSLSALVRRRPRPAILWALPLVFVKEDQGFTVAAIGLVMAGMGLAMLARGDDPPGPRWLKASAGPGGRPRGTPRRLLRHAALALPAGARHGAADEQEEPIVWIRGGVLLAVWGLAWSVLAIAVIIPHFNAMHHYPYWYDGGVVGPGGHPSVSGLAHQVIQSGHEKLWTTFLILLPVAFLALRSPLVLIALPSLALRFISTNSYFWGTGWHYDATVMPIVFLAAVDGMARFRASSQRRALLAGAASRPGTPPVPARAASRPGTPPVLARGSDPPNPPLARGPRDFVAGALALSAQVQSAQQRSSVPSGCGRGQEVSPVLVQATAHRGERDRACRQGLEQPAGRHADQTMPLRQPLRLGGDLRAEVAVERGHHHIRAGQGHPAVGGEAVVRDAAMTLPGVGVADPQGR